MVETNELTRKLRTLLHPRAALIVYAEENDNHSTDDDGYFIEVRDIDENGTMGEGRPVTVEFMNELVRGYSESHSVTPYGRIPSNLLWFDPVSYTHLDVYKRQGLSFRAALFVSHALWK